MSQTARQSQPNVTNEVTARAVSAVVQARQIHGGVHLHPVAPATTHLGPAHPSPWLAWAVLGALSAVLTTVAVTLPVNNTAVVGEPVPQPRIPPTGPPPVESSTFTLSGTLTVNQTPDDHGKDIAATSLGCEGAGSYSDLSAGTAVIVRDPEGRQVAVGALRAGHLADGNSNSCVMTFSVPDVPRDLASYSVTISHRGTLVKTLDEALAGIALSIGG